MSPTVPQNSFVGGEWAPSLYGRFDLQKFMTSVRRMRNFFPHPHGGASNRGGTEFIAETKHSTKKARLVPFQYSSVQSYVLEFGDQYMRVFKDGGQVLTDLDLVVTSGQTVTIGPGEVKDYESITVEPGGILEVTQGFDFAYIGVKGNLINNGTIRAVSADNGGVTPPGNALTKKAPDAAGHPNTTGEALTWAFVQGSGGAGGTANGNAGGIASYGGNGGGGASYGATGAGSSYAAAGSGAPGGYNDGFQGGAGGAGATLFSFAGKKGGDGAEQFDSEDISLGYSAPGGGGGGFRGRSGGAIYFKVKGNVSGSGTFDLRGQKGGDGGAPGADPSGSHAAAAGGGGAGGHGGKLYIRHGGTMTFPTAKILVSGGAKGLKGAAGAGDGVVGSNGSYDIAAFTPVEGQWPLGADAYSIFELSTPYLEADLPLLKFSQSADVLYVTHPSYAPKKICRYSHNQWTIADIKFGTQIVAPSSLTRSSGTGTGASYVVTSVNADGEESEASAAVAGGKGDTFTWSANGAVYEYFNFYKDEHGSGVYGWIGQASSPSFTEPTGGIEPDYEKTPPKSRNPFDGPGNYPGCSAFFEQRQLFGPTINKPGTFWGTVIGSFENLNVSSPLQDDDAFEFTIATKEVNEIRWFVPLNELLIGTSGSEWKAAGGGQSGVITPTSINLRPQSRWGVSHVQPLVIGASVLFIEGSGAVVRDLNYSLEADGYKANDLSLLANHLFRNYQIVDWAYQQHPDSIVWAVRSDGALLGLTYYKEHEVWGWHVHATDGQFEAVASIRTSEGNDELYAIVKREIDGVTKRYVERFVPRLQANANFEVKVEDSHFVDSGLTYDGSNTDTTKTLNFNGGVGWTVGSLRLLGAIGHSPFTADSVGKKYRLRMGSDSVDVLVTEYYNGTTVRVQIIDKTVPASLQGYSTSDWAILASTFQGLEHLEGKEIVALADGNVISGLTVSSGSVSISNPAGKVIMGLPYECLIETHDLDYQTEDGSVQDKMRDITSAVFKLENTRQLFAGPDEDHLVEYAFRTDEDYGVPTRMYTGDVEMFLESGNGRKGRVVIKTVDPVPCTVLSLIARMVHGEQ